MIRDDLAKLSDNDIYSLILFALYKIKNIPEYSTLSELAFILNKESFLNIVDYLGGLTIRIPTSKELLVIVNALLLYQYHNIENIDFDKSLKMLEKTNLELLEIKETYYKLLDILTDYNINK